MSLGVKYVVLHIGVNSMIQLCFQKRNTKVGSVRVR